MPGPQGEPGPRSSACGSLGGCGGKPPVCPVPESIGGATTLRTSRSVDRAAIALSDTLVRNPDFGGMLDGLRRQKK